MKESCTNWEKLKNANVLDENNYIICAELHELTSKLYMMILSNGKCFPHSDLD